MCHIMKISYNKLWKILIDRGMKKKDLISLTGISSSSMAKLSKNEIVSLEVLIKICNGLKCNIGDIMDVINEVKDKIYG